MAEGNARIKCVIWDLDNTLWEGTLSEGGGTALRRGAKEAVLELDRRGIVQSIASKNDRGAALGRLAAYGLEDYFLCPQISWNPKSGGVQAILAALNIKPEAAALVDDSAFERDEVGRVLPALRRYDGGDLTELLSLPEFQVPFITEDAANRRKMYQADLARQDAEKAFAGNADDFLATLHMKLEIAPVTERDLQRVEELTVRTHQLNSTGYTYSYEELAELSRDPKYLFFVCGLTDDYGDSGKVGLLLLENGGDALRIKLLIVSCRVMSRGIGSALLCCATQLAHRLGKPLLAEYLETEYNRIMYITYKLAGFEEIEEQGGEILLRYAQTEPLPFAEYLEVSWQAAAPEGPSEAGSEKG